jgi:hypothetical protein
MQDPPASANPTEHWHLALPAADSSLAGHVSHPAVPTALLNVPASHAAHATPSEAAVYPATQVQFANSVLPSDELVFEGHAPQSADPAVALYDPARHTAHTPASATVNPAEHWHSALPDKDSALAGQVSHPAVPTALLNVPAVHALHATPSEAAVYPERHLQSASSMLPAAEMVFEGHAAQLPAPTALMNVPASHAAQLPEPAVALYVPASHATHAESAPVNPAVYPAGQGPRHSATEGRLSPISPLPSPRYRVSPMPSSP